MTLAFTILGSIAAALAFRYTRSGQLALGSGAVMVTRITIGVAVLMGFVALGFNLAGHEDVAGGINPWWTCLIFWGLSAFGAYTLFEGR